MPLSAPTPPPRSGAGLGSLLRQHREAAGLTQDELADRAGLSARTVSDVERGLRSRLYADTAQRLVVALGLDGADRGFFLQAARGRPVAPAPTSQLPRPLTALVGREPELTELTDALAPAGRRLVTLTGLGGVGKTRLALAVAERLSPAYDGLVRFAPIAPNQDPDLLIGLIAGSLGASADASPELLATFLAGRPMLLVLDAFEHVLTAAAAVESMLLSVPSLQLLVTSRDRVRIHGAYQLALGPLTVPDRFTPSWRSTGAAALFLDRAADLRADLDDDPELVLDICRQVSGIPLAIELAAARVRHLPLAALRERLRHGLDDLVEGEHDRQRSLAETLGWSVSSLTAAESALLDVCALFPGGWRLDVIDSCCAEADVIGAMSNLVDRGLVVLDRSLGQADATPRWRMLDVVREFVLARSEPPDAVLRGACQQALLELLSQATEQVGHEQAWFGLLAGEEANVRAALVWAEEDQDAETLLRLACGMWQFWQARGALVEGRQWLATGLGITPVASDETRMNALWGSAWLAYQQGDHLAAESAGLELTRLASGPGREAARRNAVTVLGIVALTNDRSDDAVDLFSQALTIARGLDRPWILATSLLNLGMAHLSAGDADAARESVGEALQRYADIGDERFHARCLGYLGLTSLVEGDPLRARALLARSLMQFHALDEPAGTAEGLAGLAAVHAATGQYSSAATLAGAVERLRATYAGQGLPLDRRITDRHLEAARLELGATAWHRELHRGRHLTLDEAVELALVDPA
jgi:predicted ATPase/DNA-binding XRE family transcriptional regulator